MTPMWQDRTPHGTRGESPGILLWQASHAWQRQIGRALRAMRLTHAQYLVLAALAWLEAHGSPPTQIAVARLCHIDANMASQLLRHLERKGLIERRRLADERAKSPRLTPAGTRLLAAAVDVLEAVDSAFFAALGRDRERFTRVVAALAGEKPRIRVRHGVMPGTGE